MRVTIPDGQAALVFDREDLAELNTLLLRIIREASTASREKPARVSISREDRRTLVLFIASHDAEQFGAGRQGA